MQFEKNFFDAEYIDDFFVDSRMKQFWAASIETLEEIDKVCKKHNITWYADWGTLLGTVRHKGFIPWDDDMDIKVFREDYPAFCEAMRKHLPEYLHFIEPQDYSPAFYDFIPRIYDERYPLREETAEDRYYKNYQNRIGIDVFIFDVAPDSILCKVV